MRADKENSQRHLSSLDLSLEKAANVFINDLPRSQLEICEAPESQL